MDIKRLTQLAGLTEAIQVEDPDEEDRRDDEKRARELKVRQAIQMVFYRLKLDVAENGIIYFEDDREAMVTLDDTEVSIKLLAELYNSGLSTDYKIQAGKHELYVVFVVSSEIDHAKI